MLVLGKRIISPPENNSFRKDLCFSPDVFISEREISKMHGLTGVKLHDGQYWAEFYNAGPKFWGAHPENKFRGHKHAKFSLIADELEVR